jgi:predicted GTPase
MTVGYDAAHSRGETVARALNDIAGLIGEGRDDLPGLHLTDDARALATRARDLTQGMFKILVIGEFKNGKSTLLNAMLGRKTLPAKAAPATAVITLLVPGDRSEVAVFEEGRAEPR